MDGDVCRLCKRQVHDLTAMGDAERKAFLASCETEVYVSYTLPLKQAVVAAMLAASAGLPATGQSLSDVLEQVQADPQAKRAGWRGRVPTSSDQELIEIPDEEAQPDARTVPESGDVSEPVPEDTKNDR